MMNFDPRTMPGHVAGNSGRSDPNLQVIASRQKILLLCILCRIGCLISLLVIGAAMGTSGAGLMVGIQVIYLISIPVGLIFLLLLSMRTHGVVFAILFLILGAMPVIGLLILLLVNGKATRMLRAGGYRVGLMGAS